MKKYTAPSLKVVNIENEAILAGSTFNTSSATDYSAGRLGAKRRFDDFDFIDESEETEEQGWY